MRKICLSQLKVERHMYKILGAVDDALTLNCVIHTHRSNSSKPSSWRLKSIIFKSKSNSEEYNYTHEFQPPFFISIPTFQGFIHFFPKPQLHLQNLKLQSIKYIDLRSHFTDIVNFFPIILILGKRVIIPVFKTFWSVKIKWRRFFIVRILHLWRIKIGSSFQRIQIKYG